MTSRQPITLGWHFPRHDWLPGPHGRQLDGLGVGLSSHADADVDYTFVQVGVKNSDVGYSGNCGNITSAISPFAVYASMIEKMHGRAKVRTHNTNTGQVLDSTFTVDNGEAIAEGRFHIDEVGGTADKIQLDFIDPGCLKTGSLLPTGNEVNEFEGVKVFRLDAGNPCVFVAAESIGVEGSILPDDVDSRADLNAHLEVTRRKAVWK